MVKRKIVIMNTDNTNYSKTYKTARIILYSIFGLGLIPALMMAMISPMFFDAPGSEAQAFTWVLFWGVLSVPVLIILSIPVSLILARRKKYKTSLWVSLLPLLSLIWIIAGFVIVQLFNL